MLHNQVEKILTHIIEGNSEELKVAVRFLLVKTTLITTISSMRRPNCLILLLTVLKTLNFLFLDLMEEKSERDTLDTLLDFPTSLLRAETLPF